MGVRDAVQECWIGFWVHDRHTEEDHKHRNVHAVAMRALPVIHKLHGRSSDCPDVDHRPERDIYRWRVRLEVAVGVMVHLRVLVQ